MFAIRTRVLLLTVAVASLAGLSVPRSHLSAQGPDATLAALQRHVDRLEALTERAEALSAIKRLQHAYGHYSELGLWHDFADLFADSGVGRYTQGDLDREGIRSLFLKEVGQGQLGLANGRIYPHISMQPVITLAPDGQSAKGRWHIMAMLGGFGRSASWAGGVYENEYVRERGVWKMKDVRYYPQYSGRYEDAGWAATRDAAPLHFTVDRVGGPIVDAPRGANAVEPSPGAPTIEALTRRMTDLSARAQRLADEIDVTNLQHAYGYYVDRKLWDDVADLFAPDGTMEIGLRGVYAGRASIRRGLNAVGTIQAPAAGGSSRTDGAGLADGEVNDRIHLQTIVTVSADGRRAKARGTELAMTGTAGGRPLLSQSIYENEFVKQNGTWTIQRMHVYPRFIVDAELGWAKDAQAAPGPSREFPPDRPSTERYEIYPAFHVAPLHYLHPVTGRAPQYPAGAAPTSAPSLRDAIGQVRPDFPGVRPAPQTTAARKTTTLTSLVESTERSLDRSSAYHAAENLSTAYGYYIDEFKWDDAADLFSANGSREMDDAGTYVGRVSIRESMVGSHPSPRPAGVSLHQVVQPVIHVAPDGRTAAIRMRLLQMTSPAGGQGSWTSGIYENTAVLEKGVWRLSGMDLDYVWQAPSRGGWTRVTAPVPTRVLPFATEFRPARPLRGPAAPPFPKHAPMPFHYTNPVSGRVPALLLR
jgi:hypothetical protein